MMAEFSIGRATVREALRLLEAYGLIEVRRGGSRGPVVCQPEPDRLAPLLSLVLRISNVTFGEIVQARQVIEPALAARAAERSTPERVQELVDIEEALEEGLADELAFHAANRAIHTAVVEAGGNRLLAALWAAISRIADGHEVGVHYETALRREVTHAHMRVIDAIRSDDCAAAAMALERHVNALEAHLERYYPALLPRPVQLVSAVRD